MSKKKSDPSIPFPELDIKAVTCFRVDHLSGEAFELEIENGVVTSMERVGRGPDLPAVTIGCAQRSLWSQLRLQQKPKAKDAE